jgi:hypothetical protein
MPPLWRSATGTRLPATNMRARIERKGPGMGAMGVGGLYQCRVAGFRRSFGFRKAVIIDRRKRVVCAPRTLVQPEADGL